MAIFTGFSFVVFQRGELFAKLSYLFEALFLVDFCLGDPASAPLFLGFNLFRVFEVERVVGRRGFLQMCVVLGNQFRLGSPET